MNSFPHQSYRQLFFRFLKFGLLAWGGPVAQIAMLRQELVDEEKWISSERFQRVLALYQVLPGPEAHELCVYFGMVARGKLGGMLAGLGFMLPGFMFMFALSWFYVTYGISSPLFAGVFYGFQAAVAALILRAVHRIGSHALHNKWLWGITLLGAVAKYFDVNFFLPLVAGGVLYMIAQRMRFHAFPILFMPIAGTVVSLVIVMPTALDLFGYGLRAGLLTFGGAYTAIPFLQHDAVISGAWMTNQQFLDGLALSSILPAPLIIFSTFLGYLGAGPLGAVAITTGIFLPAFLFTLLGHDFLERLIDNPEIHSFLDGVTAALVGLIAVTALQLFQSAVPDLTALGIFVFSLLAIIQWKAKASVAVIMIGAGLLGALVK